MFTHFNTQVFINALKANQNLVTFLSTTFALMLTLLLQGSIQGNLKPTYFLYALLVCIAFAIWTSIDQKFRGCKKVEIH